MLTDVAKLPAVPCRSQLLILHHSCAMAALRYALPDPTIRRQSNATSE